MDNIQNSMDSKIVVLRIRSGDPSDLHLNEKDFGLDLQREITARGGTCVARWADEMLTLLVQGIAPAQIDQLIAPFLDAARKKGRRLEVVQVEKDASAGFR